MITPERMHYQAIELPPPGRWKVYTPRPAYFDTLDEAKAYAEIYFAKRGVLVAVEEVRK